MKYSASSVKNFCWSRQKWAGKYVLWVKDVFTEDSFAVGDLIENYLKEGTDNYEIIKDRNIEKMDAVLADYDTAKYNAEWLGFVKWIDKVKFEGIICWQVFIWFPDNLIEGEYVDDIKSSRNLTKIGEDEGGKNMWSNMSTYEEYELQMWIYMRLTKINKARIFEVAKHKYKDWRRAHQIIHFELTPEFNKKMEDKYGPIIQDMSAMWNKFSWVIPNKDVEAPEDD